MANRRDFHSSDCDECGTPMIRTETSFAVVLTCENCGFSTDDDEQKSLKPIKRKKRFIE